VRKVPFAESVNIIGRGIRNWFAERPIVVSFEVTDSCTCYCKHCDHGGPRDDSRDMKPSEYRRYADLLRPCVVQISGGEPLMRPDLNEIVQNIKSPDGLPYTILVSNWSLMTERRYLELRRAGVDQFSVSLDFPDDRHDDFRGLPGLFAHMNELMPKLAAYGYDDIVLNNCITRENLPYINAAADKAKEWGVNISYSAYSAKRTGCRDYFISRPEDLALLRQQLSRVKERMDKTKWIVNSKTTIDATREYFERGGAPGCKAGQRFLVVTSQGQLQPCSMQFTRYPLENQSDMVSRFTTSNRCDECYVAIRSYLDKSLPRLMYESVSGHFSFTGRGECRSDSSQGNQGE
jgi:MoaA/NifB/PqqE/SkfB family radical SAM enzyme